MFLDSLFGFERIHVFLLVPVPDEMTEIDSNFGIGCSV